MEPNKKNAGQATNAATAGMPDWVKHLLTGLGALGIDFLLFIKPLQDKFEAQSRQLNEQEKRIADLEDQLNTLIRNPKRNEPKGEPIRELDDELFNFRKKKNNNSRFQKPNYAKL